LKPFPQGVHNGADGETVMVRIEVGSGCDT
jgi:hypothetical protein